VVAAAVPQGLDHLLAPLDGAVGGGAGTAGLELRGGGQQDDRAVGIEVFRLAGHGGHGGGGRRVGVDHHQQVQLVHGALHFQTARL